MYAEKLQLVTLVNQQVTNTLDCLSILVQVPGKEVVDCVRLCRWLEHVYKLVEQLDTDHTKVCNSVEAILASEHAWKKEQEKLCMRKSTLVLAGSKYTLGGTVRRTSLSYTECQLLMKNQGCFQCHKLFVTH